MPHCVFLLNDALSSSQTMGEDEALVFPRETLSDKQEEQNRFQHIQNWLESMESRYWKSIIPIKLGIHLIKIYYDWNDQVGLCQSGVPDVFRIELAPR